MIKQLARLFGRAREAAPAVEALPRAAVDMHWFDGTELPIPDWQRIGEAEPRNLGDVAEFPGGRRGYGNGCASKGQGLEPDLRASKALLQAWAQCLIL